MQDSMVLPFQPDGFQTDGDWAEWTLYLKFGWSVINLFSVVCWREKKNIYRPLSEGADRPFYIMLFYEVVQALCLGDWHELAASWMTAQEPTCLVVLQFQLRISAAILHQIVNDFIELKLVYLDGENSDMIQVDVDGILNIASRLPTQELARKVSRRSLESRQ